MSVAALKSEFVTPLVGLKSPVGRSWHLKLCCTRLWPTTAIASKKTDLEKNSHIAGVEKKKPCNYQKKNCFHLERLTLRFDFFFLPSPSLFFFFFFFGVMSGCPWKLFGSPFSKKKSGKNHLKEVDRRQFSVCECQKLKLEKNNQFKFSKLKTKKARFFNPLHVFFFCLIFTTYPTGLLEPTSATKFSFKRVKGRLI